MVFSAPIELLKKRRRLSSFPLNFEHCIFIPFFSQLKQGIMAFNGSEGGEISLNTASAMTKLYREEYPNTTRAHFFGKDIIDRILAQDNCVGIRMYYGISEIGSKELVLVGVDAEENDILELVADISSPCPPTCSPNNALNS